MAIHPTLRSPSDGQGALSPQQARAISAWSEQAAAHLENLTISDSVPTADKDCSVPDPTSTRSALRGTTVTLSIPLDDPVPSTGSTTFPRVRVLGRTSTEAQQVPSVSFRRREPLRRDSLKRREALLKGKDGSRRRQRWENDRLLHNPWAEPPSPNDWAVGPTYTRHEPMPYYLAPLWDVHYKHIDHTSSKQTAKGTKGEKHRVPKDLRLKLKHARAARGMLQDIEEDIRQFIEGWGANQLLLQKDGLADASASSDEDSEDEIVFVGRNGQMHDSPGCKTNLQQRQEVMHTNNKRGGEKLVFESLVDDRAAGFGRWLVHSIASYYGLHTWSVTVGEPARREAYVGFYPPAPGSHTGLVTQPTSCHQEAMIKPGDALPQPLWAQV
ncbi:R3H-associated N-terminal domain-containing protein [Aspergillus coremiiformis]|uniref:R3H-associated N-terminal domain-containing protein n=1 Tax=Aspergillus coremiiformis TaxID=138285 RepID=A0A5N6Z0H0_9EURO|nr:R3H-associated N-terminal domain-containing protein [Aspergillus coremiiformis]